MVGTSSQDIASTGTFRVTKSVGPRYVTTTAPRIADPGSTAIVTTSFTNGSGYAVHGAKLGLSGPSGWPVAATSPVSFQTVAPGQTVTTTWHVTVPQGTKPDDYQLTGTASYQAAQGGSGQSSDRVTLSVPYSSVAAAYDNVGITDDAAHGPGNFDGSGNSYSAQALAAVGIKPGSTITGRGIAFRWPDLAAGTPGNVAMQGQLISLSGLGGTLGVLGAAKSATQTGTGIAYYTDGSTQRSR